MGSSWGLLLIALDDADAVHRGALTPHGALRVRLEYTDRQTSTMGWMLLRDSTDGLLRRVESHGFCCAPLFYSSCSDPGCELIYRFHRLQMYQ